MILYKTFPNDKGTGDRYVIKNNSFISRSYKDLSSCINDVKQHLYSGKFKTSLHLNKIIEFKLFKELECKHPELFV